MDAEGIQRYVRQQLGFARIHLASVEASTKLPPRLAAKQAVVAALHLAIQCQTNALRRAESEGNTLDSGLSEWQNLLQADSRWLNDCLALTASLNQSWRRDPDRAKTKKAVALIATTTPKASHWGDASADELSSLVDAFQEFIDRHSASSQEW